VTSSSNDHLNSPASGTQIKANIKYKIKEKYMHEYNTRNLFGRLFVKQFALCYQTVVCLSVCPVCDVDVLWPNGWMY